MNFLTLPSGNSINLDSVTYALNVARRTAVEYPNFETKHYLKVCFVGGGALWLDDDEPDANAVRLALNVEAPEFLNDPRALTDPDAEAHMDAAFQEVAPYTPEQHQQDADYDDLIDTQRCVLIDIRGG